VIVGKVIVGKVIVGKVIVGKVYRTRLMYQISRNFLSSTLQSLQNPYYLVLVNPIFDELSFGIKFIISPS
jgi:hypothetical protein